MVIYAHTRHVQFADILAGLIEQVKDGSTLRIRLLMPDGDHQFVNIALAGVRCARAGGKPGEVSEQWGEEVGHMRARVNELRTCSYVSP